MDFSFSEGEKINSTIDALKWAIAKVAAHMTLSKIKEHHKEAVKH